MLVGNGMSLLARHNIPSMNLANKSWSQPHIMNVSDDRLHATTSVYSTWLILHTKQGSVE